MQRKIRTDLAIENREIYMKGKEAEEKIEGVETTVDNSVDGILITKVKVTSNEGAQIIGKPIGNYITFEVPKIKDENEEFNSQVSNKVKDVIRELAHIKKEDNVLVVGLGNWDITADALGPKVVSEIEITRHMLEYAPQYVVPGAISVCAIAPGVLGSTGIETGEIVKGIVEKAKPTLIIAIDALASRKMERVSTTIQISDTGIIPGAGIGNKRNAIDKETLGVPVIAIGVPTVVDAATIANDTLELLEEELKDVNVSNQYEHICEKLLPENLNYIVTPDDIDSVITNISGVVARAINDALVV